MKTVSATSAALQEDLKNFKEQIVSLQKDWGSVLPKIKAGLNQVHLDPQETSHTLELEEAEKFALALETMNIESLKKQANAINRHIHQALFTLYAKTNSTNMTPSAREHGVLHEIQIIQLMTKHLAMLLEKAGELVGKEESMSSEEMESLKDALLGTNLSGGYDIMKKTPQALITLLEKYASREEIPLQLGPTTLSPQPVNTIAPQPVKTNVTTQPEKKRSFGSFFEFSRFKQAKKDTSIAQKEMVEVLKKIDEKIKEMPAFIQDERHEEKLKEFEGRYKLIKKGAVPVIEEHLNKAQRKHKEMSKSSVKNLSAEALWKQILFTNKWMKSEIDALNEMCNRRPVTQNTYEKEQYQEQIYTQWRKIEKRAETLQYLAKIAQLKLDPPAMAIRRRVNDTQVQKLQKAFSSTLSNFDEFEKSRNKVSKKLGISLDNTPKLHSRSHE